MPAALLAYLTVAIGGAAGAMARYGLTGIMVKSHGSIPMGTLASNLLGCFIMGVLAQLMASSSWFNDAGLFPDHYRLLFAVGFCGSFTTLSALMFELSGMLQKDQILVAFSYLFGTFVGCFACFYVGVVLVKMLASSPAT